MPEIRGRDIAMIFQEPMSSLNPVMTIGDQIGEAIMLHEPHRAASERRAQGRRDAQAGRHSRPAQAASTPIRISSPAACASA